MLRQIFVFIIIVLCAGCTVTAGYVNTSEEERKLALYQKHAFVCELNAGEQAELEIMETCSAIRNMSTSLTNLVTFAELVTAEFINKAISVPKEERATICNNEDSNPEKEAVLEQHVETVMNSLVQLAQTGDSCRASGNEFCFEALREFEQSGFVEEVEMRLSAWRQRVNTEIVPICGKEFFQFDEDVKI